MSHLYRSVLNSVDRTINSVEHFDTRDWLILLVIVVAVGLFCMRGFGSRSSY